MLFRSVLVAVFAASVLAVPAHAEPWDLVLAGGRVIDPESGLDAVRHVGIRDGSVGAISAEALEGDRVIDASGLIVAPGFIDLHVHGQEPRSYDFLAQDGVTSALELEAGVHDLDGFLARRDGVARVHFGASAGHIPARALVVDGVGLEHALTAEVMENGPRLWWTGLRMWWSGPFTFGSTEITADEREELLDALRVELDAGAIGIGLGLAYTPAADDVEIEAVFALAAERGVPVFVHLPGRSGPTDTTPLDRVLAITERTGAPLHIVHINSSSGQANREYLAGIEAARASGLDVTTEAYPYTAGSTRLDSALFDEGWQDTDGLNYGDLQWADTGERLTAESFARYRAQGGTVIIHMNEPERVAESIAHPLVMVASDGMPMVGKTPHPRGAGTRARILGEYVRERGLFDEMTAIRKLALAPAQRLEAFVPAMRNKGRLRVGADADLVVFDPARVRDRATFEAPHQPSDGIPYVVVAGTLVVDGGELVPGVAPGRPIRAAASP